MDPDREESAKPKEEGKIIDEGAYLDICVEYALHAGWVKPEGKDILVEQYLKPIYRKYIEVIEEVKAEIGTEQSKQYEKTDLKTIIREVNHILEQTQRIGSTANENITRGIDDYCKMFCRKGTYLEYATTSLAQFISDLLQ